MIHIRIDQQPLKAHRKFACGIGPELPEGDKWFYEGEGGADSADCPKCNPGPKPTYGIPASMMSGNAAQRHEDPAAWDRWVSFCERSGHP